MREKIAYVATVAIAIIWIGGLAFLFFGVYNRKINAEPGFGIVCACLLASAVIGAAAYILIDQQQTRRSSEQPVRQIERT